MGKMQSGKNIKHTEDGKSLLEKSRNAYEEHEYSQYVKYARKYHEKENTDESKKFYEKAIEREKIYEEIKEKMKHREDPYKFLDVNENSSDEEIKKQYQKYLYRYHPNRSQVKDATEFTSLLEEIYRKIETEERRREFKYSQGNPEGCIYMDRNMEKRDILNEIFNEIFSRNIRMNGGRIHVTEFENRNVYSYAFGDAIDDSINSRMFERIYRKRKTKRDTPSPFSFLIYVILAMLFMYIS